MINFKKFCGLFWIKGYKYNDLMNIELGYIYCVLAIFEFDHKSINIHISEVIHFFIVKIFPYFNMHCNFYVFCKVYE